MLLEKCVVPDLDLTIDNLRSIRQLNAAERTLNDRLAMMREYEKLNRKSNVLESYNASIVSTL